MGTKTQLKKTYNIKININKSKTIKVLKPFIILVVRVLASIFL